MGNEINIEWINLWMNEWTNLSINQCINKERINEEARREVKRQCPGINTAFTIYFRKTVKDEEFSIVKV